MAKRIPKEPNDFLVRLIEHSPYSMWISDEKGGLIHLNQAFRDLFRVRDDEVVGKYNIFRDEVVKAKGLEPIIKKVFENGETARFCFEYDTSKIGGLDLEERVSLVLDVAIIPILDGQGKIRHAIAHQIDITGNKRAEEELRESEQKMMDILLGSPIPAFVIGKDHKVIHWNKALKEMSGIEPGEVIGTDRHWQAFYKEKRPCLADLLVGEAVEKISQWYAGKYTKSKFGEGAYEATDFFPTLGEGGKWLRFTASAIRDSRGNLIGAMETLEDITERKRAEDALRNREKEYRSVIENIQDVFYRSDRNGRLIMGSPSGAKMFGYSSIEEMIGLPLDCLWVNPKDRDPLLEQVKTTGEMRDFDAFLKRKDGTTFHGSLNVHFYYDDQGNLLGTEGIVRDITARKRAEEALRESEERYRHVVELSPELIAVHSNGKYAYVNPTGVRFLGAKGAEELIGRSIFDIIHPDYWKIVRERMEMTYKEGKDVPLIEERYVRLDGKVIDVEVASAFLHYQGQPAALVIARDITKRKQVEDALRKSEKEAKSLLQETGIMAEIGRIISSTLHTNEVYERFVAEVRKLVPFDRISINEVNVSEGTGLMVYAAGLEIPTRKVGDFYPLAGSAGGELLRTRSGFLVQGESMQEFAIQHPAYLPCYQAGIRSLVAAPLILRDRIIGTLILDSLRPDAYSEQDLKLVERIANQIAGAVANAQLFKKQKRTEEELFKSNERYRRLVEMSPLMVSIQKEGKYVYLNPAALRALGASKPEELLGKSIFEMIHPDYWDATKDRQRLIEKGKPAPLIEEKVIRLDKKVIDVELCQIEVFDQDEQAIMVMGQDITEQKKAEKEKELLQEQLRQAQKMEAIGTLAGGIAHDFNNILAGIIGYAELASLDIPEGSKAHQNLQNSIKSALRAKSLVQQILAFSRQGKQERKPLDIRPIVKEGLKLLRASLPATIEIRQEIGQDLGTIEADPTQVYQVLMNLCTNAAQAMEKEGGILEISLENVEMKEEISTSLAGIEPGPYLRLRVSDTGHGIPPEILPRIYDPYFTTKEVGKGTGLGLAVANGIVKSYGGGIAVSSEVGKGSTFHVYFPSIKVPSSTLEVGKVEPLPLGGRERVLFVDDEPGIVEVGQRYLEYLGYEVVARTSSLEALELFRVKKDHFDLVITDMTMPNLTGDRLAQELLKIRPDFPVILCTGFSERITDEKAKAIGIQEFVLKPLVMLDLAKAIRRALESRKKKI